MGSSEEQSFLGARWRRWRGRWAELPAKRRETVGAAVVLGLLIAMAFLPLFAGENFLPFARYPNWGESAAEACGQSLVPDKAFWDRKAEAPWIADSEFAPLSVYWPLDTYVANSVKHGRLPLWDPYTAGGMPTFDNGEYRPFNPLRWLYYLAPSPWMFCLTLVLELFVGGWGMIFLLRRAGYEPAAALLGSAALFLNPWTLERLTMLQPSAYVYLPWALLGLRQAKLANWRSLALGCLPFLLMGQAGHPEPCLIAAALTGLAYLSGGLDGPDGEGRQTLLHRIGVLSVIGVLTALSLAILWVPVLVMDAHSFSYKKTGLPFLFEYSWKGLFTPASDLFFLPALLSFPLMAPFARRRKAAVWLAVAFVALLLLVREGEGGTALKGLLQTHVFVLPLYYFKDVFWIAVAMLLPSGFEALTNARGRSRWLALALAVSALILITVLSGDLRIPTAQRAFLPGLTLTLLALGILALGGLLLFSKRVSPTGRMFLVAFILLPLALPLSSNQLPWNGIRTGRSEAAQWLHAKYPHARSVSIGWNPYFIIPPNQGEIYRTRMVSENATFILNDYFQLFFSPPAPPTCIMYRAVDPFRFIQAGASVILLPRGTRLQGVQPTWEGKTASAYEIPGARGRVFFAFRMSLRERGVPLAGQIEALGGGRDGVAVVETMGQPAPSTWPEGPVVGGRLTFVRDGAETVTIAAQAPREALLVLRDSWYPGWRATVDGRRVPIYRVNGCFRGVLVPAGKHEVRFVYRPWHVYIPAAISLLTTLLVIGGAWSGFRRRPPPVQGTAGG